MREVFGIGWGVCLWFLHNGAIRLSHCMLVFKEEEEEANLGGSVERSGISKTSRNPEKKEEEKEEKEDVDNDLDGRRRLRTRSSDEEHHTGMEKFSSK